MAGASFTTSIPLDLYASLMAEVKSTGESRNAVVIRALRSALVSTDDGRVPADGEQGRHSRQDVLPPAQTQVLDESVASPCCGADLDESEGRRFCSDCGTLVPS